MRHRVNQQAAVDKPAAGLDVAGRVGSPFRDTTLPPARGSESLERDQQHCRILGVGTLRRDQAHDGGHLRLRAGARRTGAHLAPGVGAHLSRPEGRTVRSGRRHLARQCLTAEDPARAGPGGDRHRQDHHLPGTVQVPDGDRLHRACGRRCPDGAAGGATQEACRRGALRGKRKASAALSAAGDRCRHLANRRRDPRHSPPHLGPVSAACPRLARKGAGRNLRAGSGERHQRVQPAGAGRSHPASPT